MPVLLLAQGDDFARGTLSKAIEARYGIRPPVLDTLQINFKGQIYRQLPEGSRWFPIQATARFHFPGAMRWDYVIAPPNQPMQRHIEAFDGLFHRRVCQNRQLEIIKAPAHIASIRRRIWALTTIMLTPLSDIAVKLSSLENGIVRATNTQLCESADISFYDDYMLKSVQAYCINPDSHTEQHYIIEPSKNMVPIGNLLFPDNVQISWDHQPVLQLKPVSLKSNLALPNAIFILAK